jgi:integrase
VSEPIKKRGSGRLVLDVQPNGVKTFFFQYFRKQDGKSKRILVNIGPYKKTLASPGKTLEEAGRKSREYADMLHENRDPKLVIEEQEYEQQEKIRLIGVAKNQGSLEQLFDSYLAAMEADGKRSYISVGKSLTTYVKTPFPEMIKRKADTIDANDIRLILSKMIKKGVTTHTNRVRSYLHAAFSHGLKQDNNPRRYSEEEVKFNLKFNPVTFVPKQADYERVGEHVVSEKEIIIIWEKLPKESDIAAWVVKLAFTTGQRSGEIMRLKWTDIDLGERLMTIPANVSKNKLDHVVPLDALSWEVIQEVKKETIKYSHLFPASNNAGFLNDKHIFSTTISKVIREYCKDNKKVQKFLARDIRRTVKTLMGKAGIDKAIRDRIQNHALQDVSSKHYDRYDYLPEKRQALKVWNDYLDLIINPRKKVVHISKGKA